MTFIFLTKQFYDDYAHCPEIEQKLTRPYVLACVQIGDVTFAVPLRSHIRHTHVLWTDKANGCGLDFSKTVVLAKESYIDRIKKPHIRPLEFDALRGKEYLIQQKLLKFIRTYQKAKLRLDVPRNQRLCAYSTLQYFEEYLEQ